MHSVKGFANVHFDGNIPFITLLIKDVNAIQGSKDTIFNMSTLNKAELIGRNNFAGNLSTTISQDFEDDLVKKLPREIGLNCTILKALGTLGIKTIKLELRLGKSSV